VSAAGVELPVLSRNVVSSCDNSSTINPRDRIMYAHIESNVGGWWAGVLHPMEAADHLITMLLVGLLGGLAVRAGRSSWTLPAMFAVSVGAFGLVGLALHHAFDIDTALFALAAVLGVMVVVHPRRTRVVAPFVVVVSGALHGLAHSTDAAGTSRPFGYVAGFTFTGGLLLAVGAIVGSAVGRWLRGREPLDDPSEAAADDHVMV
jgi:urease accessory protein